MEQRLGKVGWLEVSFDEIAGLSLGEIGQKLRDNSWTATKGVWEAKAQELLNLGVEA